MRAVMAHLLVWLLCVALVRAGFHYPHEIMVQDEETGGTSKGGEEEEEEALAHNCLSAR